MKLARVRRAPTKVGSNLNKGFIIEKKDLLYKESRATCLFRESGVIANGVYCSTNHREYSMFSLFLLSSAAFCDFITDIIQGLRSL